MTMLALLLRRASSQQIDRKVARGLMVERDVGGGG